MNWYMILLITSLVLVRCALLIVIGSDGRVRSLVIAPACVC